MKYKRRRSHRNYVGRRRTERNRSKITVFLIILFSVAVFAGAVLLGNHLKEKAEISRENRYNEEQKQTETGETENAGESDSPAEALKAPEKMKSEYVDLNGEAHPDGSVEISFVARDFSGTLGYSSEVAMDIGYQKENLLITSSEIAEKTADLYTSAFFGLASEPLMEPTFTKLYEALWISLFEELADAGVDEIILCGFEDDISEEEIAKFSSLAKRFREENKESELLLGIMLPYSFFEREDTSAKCSEILHSFEFIAADLTDTVPSEEISASEMLEARVDLMQIYFSRFSVRAVLDSDSESLGEMLEILDSAYVNCTQTVSLGALLGMTSD